MFEEYLEILRSKESLLRIKERLNKKMIINFQRVISRGKVYIYIWNVF